MIAITIDRNAAFTPQQVARNLMLVARNKLRVASILPLALE